MTGFGFAIVGGEDVDGMQPHVDSVDPFGAAAAAGLHVGDFILSVNGQSYKHAAHSKVRGAIKAAETMGQLSISVYRDFGLPRAEATPRALDATPRRTLSRSGSRTGARPPGAE